MPRWALILSRVQTVGRSYPKLQEVRVLVLDSPPSTNIDDATLPAAGPGDISVGDIDEIEITPLEGLDFVLPWGKSFQDLLSKMTRHDW